MANETPSCYCNAYPFPHRRGSGDCKGHWYPYLCSNCGAATRVHEVLTQAEPEAGIARTRVDKVSHCCEAALLSNDKFKREVLNDDCY